MILAFPSSCLDPCTHGLTRMTKAIQDPRLLKARSLHNTVNVPHDNQQPSPFYILSFSVNRPPTSLLSKLPIATMTKLKTPLPYGSNVCMMVASLQGPPYPFFSFIAELIPRPSREAWKLPKNEYDNAYCMGSLGLSCIMNLSARRR